MKRKMKKLMKKMAAIVLSAEVLMNLAGCSSVPPKGYVPEGYVPEGYVPEGYVPAGYISIEDAQSLFSSITLPIGYLDGTSDQIPDEDGDRISQEILEMEESFVAADSPVVNAREWSIYTSQLARENLTFEEAAFYGRLDELCRKYMDSAALDGIRREDLGRILTDMVSYGDLALTKDQAQATALWFKYNNPQYYFITSSVVTTSNQKLGFCIYEFASDGGERAKITNDLFGKLDSWIESANNGGTSTWQKEFTANNLLCKNIVYNNEYAKNKDLMGQTLYSAVMLEGTVCAGYAAAFSAMMNASGIDTAVVLSPTHAWNVVRYDDGNYYAVDVTWNDNKEDDNNPNNEYFNVGEPTLKNADGGAHTYSSKYISWSPEIAQNDCPPAGQGSSPKLGVPQNLHAASDTDGKVQFAWDPVDGAENYNFEVYSGDMANKLYGGLIEGTSVSVTYNSLTSLAVRVRAEAGSGKADIASDWSEFLCSQTNADQLPEAKALRLDKPENIKVTKEDARRTFFSWDPVEGADQYEFVLFRDSGYKETWSSAFKTEAEIGFGKLQPHTTYYYGVRAMKTVDGQNYYSEWNYFSHETPEESSAGPAPDKPSAPENAKTVAVSQNQSKTTWDAVPGATGYQIRLYKDPSYKELWTEFSKTGTQLNLSKIAEGTTYYYAIRAVNAANGQEAYSDWVTFTYTHTGEPASN